MLIKLLIQLNRFVLILARKVQLVAFYARGADDTSIGSVTPDVIDSKTVGDTHDDDDTNINLIPPDVNEL